MKGFKFGKPAHTFTTGYPGETMIALEPRVLLDAALGLTLADVDARDHTTDPHPEPLLPQQQDALLESLALASPLAPQGRNELLFVSESLRSDPLFQGFLADVEAREGEIGIHFLGGGGELDTINDTLQLYGDLGLKIDAIHIFSHASAGALTLGETTLTLDSLDQSSQNSDTIRQWGERFSEKADILLYGCNLAANESGKMLLQRIATLSSADVAASDDATGAQARGGDWILEQQTGEIDTAPITPLIAESGYDGLLAAPEVTVPEDPFSVDEDTPLTISGVTVADGDDSPLSMTVSVTNGTVTLASTTGLGSVSGNGSGTITFSGQAAAVNTALNGMTYQATAHWNGGDTLSVTANDGSSVNSTIVINVLPINDLPTLVPTSLSVDEGQSGVAFAEVNLGLDDADVTTTEQSTAQEMIKLATLPAHGTLSYSGSPVVVGTAFSVADIANLSYSHNGDDVESGDSDSFTVTLNDGAGSGDTGPYTLPITLNPINAAPSISGSPTVYEGQGAENEPASSDNGDGTEGIALGLTLSDEESGHADTAAASTVTITNIATDNEGTLYRDANNNQRYDSGEELTGAGPYTFSGDLLGQLRFNHDGDEPDATLPGFDIAVEDAGGGQGAGSKLSSGTQHIDITVIANDDDPVLAVNVPQEINAGDTFTITTAMLQVTDIDGEDLVYTVEAVPAKGELQINDGGWKTLGTGGRFTQDDIDNGRLQYVQSVSVTDTDGAGPITQDLFQFSVRDSVLKAWNTAGEEGAIYNEAGAIKTDNTFNITIQGDQTANPSPGGAAAGYGGDIEVDSSVSAGISANQIAEADNADGGNDTHVITTGELQYILKTADSSYTVPATETWYTITSLPGNGRLQHFDGSNWINVALYENFTQQDIDDNKLRFVHDGSETHFSDFGYSVSDGGPQRFNNTFDIAVDPVNDRPSAGGGSKDAISEGATVRVTASDMAMGDADNSDEIGDDPDTTEATVDPLWFRVTTLPDDGDLERWNGSAWVAVTTDDWLSNELLSMSADSATSGLRYIHGGGDQAANRTDSYQFVVRDDLAAPTNSYDQQSHTTIGDPTNNDTGNPEHNLSTTGTVNLSIAPLNDPPVIQQFHTDPNQTIVDANGASKTSANVLLEVAEGGSDTIDSAKLTAVDPDTLSTEVRQFRITTNVAHGTLMLSGSALGVGSTFTQADIDNNLLTYEHDGSEEYSDNFQFIVSDSVDDHLYAVDGASGASQYDIIVNSATNDPATITYDGESTVDLFGEFTYNFASTLTIADEDLDAVNGAAGESDFLHATVVLKDKDGNAVDLSGSGSIALGSTSGLTQTDSDDNDGEIAFQGTLANIQAALTNLAVTVPNVDYNDSYSVEVTIDDRIYTAGGDLDTSGSDTNGGETNSDGSAVNAVNNTATIAVTLRASDDNDDPTETAHPTSSQTVNEDTELDLAGYQIADVDAFDSELTVTLTSTTGNGNLSATGSASASGNDSATLTLTGTVAEINASLATLKYSGDSDWHGSDSVTMTINDGGGNGSGGGGDVAGTTTNITVYPVNDTPTVTVPATQEVSGATSITFNSTNGNQITVADIKDSGQSPFTDNLRVTVDLSPDGIGTFTLAANDGATVGGSGTDTMTIEGTLVQINNALDGLTYTPNDPNSDQTAEITITVDDLANGGTTLTNGVGGSETAAKTFDVNISNVNDPPTVTAPAAATVAEDTTLTLTGAAAFSVADPDDFGADDLVATVTVSHGTLDLAADDGVTVGGRNSTTMTLTGTEAEINAALDGLEYSANADYHGTDTISVKFNDAGNTGTGGAKEVTEA
ncbi:MAG: DUF4347 domain-containing protein, partial [Gammaproteobacteria bacterium]|nr:DUF4347 domain-containing protein [Gammaproteobacteria bacterium]